MWRRLLIALLLGTLVANSVFSYHQYAEEVRSGSVPACRWTRLAVERWYSDLERQGSDGFPYYFDDELAQRYIRFAHNLRHTQGEAANPRNGDTRIRLEPWQQFAWANIFGWRRQSDGLRRFTKAYREVARKNGKTVEGAASMNAGYHMDREIGPEVFFLAVDRSQAKKAYDEAVRQNQRHPVLRQRVKEYRSSNRLVLLEDPAAFMTPVAKDHRSQDSWNPHMILVDEYHAHPTNELINVYESGMGARRQPLSLIITTAGKNTQGPAFQEERALITRILEGSIDPVPEHIWGIIYTLDEGDDWTNEAVWLKANPNLGVSLSRDYLRRRVEEAQGSPQKQSDVLTKNFNVWLNVDTRWMDHEVWKRGSVAIDEAELEGAGAVGAYDLSSTTDITAISWTFPQVNGRYPILWRFFIPEEGLDERIRRDRVDYGAWIRRGLVIPTPGDAIDYDYVIEQIQKDAERFGASKMAYDPWNATEVKKALQDEIELVKYAQRFSGMAEATKLFEELVLKHQIAHGDNPVANWMMSNVELKEDRQGNVMPMKPRRDAYGKRIDGIVAAIMSTHLLISSDGGGSDYERLLAERGTL